MLIITVFEIVLFYQFYSRKNEKSIWSAIDSRARLTPICPIGSRTEPLICTPVCTRRENQTTSGGEKMNNAIYTRHGYASPFPVLGDHFCKLPYLREERSQACVSRYGERRVWLLTQFFLVTYVLERLG